MIEVDEVEDENMVPFEVRRKCAVLLNWTDFGWSKFSPYNDHCNYYHILYFVFFYCVSLLEFWWLHEKRWEVNIKRCTANRRRIFSHWRSFPLHKGISRVPSPPSLLQCNCATPAYNQVIFHSVLNKCLFLFKYGQYLSWMKVTPIDVICGPI